MYTPLAASHHSARLHSTAQSAHTHQAHKGQNRCCKNVRREERSTRALTSAPLWAHTHTRTSLEKVSKRRSNRHVMGNHKIELGEKFIAPDEQPQCGAPTLQTSHRRSAAPHPSAHTHTERERAHHIVHTVILNGKGAPRTISQKHKRCEIKQNE